MLGYTRSVTQGATHYHTHAVNPVWNSGLVRTTEIGTHVFYRMPTGAERAYYQEALARRRGAGAARVSEAAAEPLDLDAAPAVSEAAAEAQTTPDVASETPASSDTEASLPVGTVGEVAT